MCDLFTDFEVPKVTIGRVCDYEKPVPVIVKLEDMNFPYEILESLSNGVAPAEEAEDWQPAVQDVAR